MPAVRTLVPPKQTTREADSAGATVDAPKQTTALANLPAWATAVPAVPQMEGGGAPQCYVGQLQPNTGKRNQLLAAGVEEGGFYLDNLGTVTPLKPLKFWLVEAAVYQTQMNAAGNVVFATRDMSLAQNDLHEHAVAVVIVQTPNGLVPAKCDFRKAQSPAYKAAADTLAEVLDPESGWARKSDAHKVASACPIPWGRFTTTADVQRKVGKGSGKPYFAAFGRTAPATVTEMEQLGAAIQTPEFAQAYETAKESFKSRCEYIEKAIKS
ncbi:hypothetical protein VT84_30805 [Gemmata sp. SH-PL17]|uniref:hypothetical protein n=1 Tax=Gemmata sp. SH-PL17 TaxID=1630693 RepID=UPI00078DE195|nr:hypothetical protein [Gemmata sp. SH-PL17]AMV28824.1 hypothetical protein VT84_30805 [Gemmata sp. SH-PL17]